MLTSLEMSLSCPIHLIGPNDEIEELDDDHVLDDEDDAPFSLDLEAMHDDAC